MSDILGLGLNPVLAFSSSATADHKDKKEKPETKQCTVEGSVGAVFGYYGNQLADVRESVGGNGWQPPDVAGDVDKSSTAEKATPLIALRIPVYIKLDINKNIGLSFGGVGNLDNLFSPNNLTSTPFDLTEALIIGKINASNNYIGSLSLGGFSGLSHFGADGVWDGSLPIDDYEKLRWGGRLHNNVDFGHILKADSSKYGLSLSLDWEGSYFSQPAQKEFNSLAVAGVFGKIGMVELQAVGMWKYYSGVSICTVLTGNEDPSDGNSYDDTGCWVNTCDGETGPGCWENTCEDDPPNYGGNGDVGSNIGNGIAQTVEERLDYSGNIEAVQGRIKVSPANLNFMVTGGLSFYKEDKGWFVGGVADIPLYNEYRLGVNYSFASNYSQIFADSRSTSHNLSLSAGDETNKLTVIGQLSMPDNDEDKPPYFAGITLTHYFEGSFLGMIKSLIY